MLAEEERWMVEILGDAEQIEVSLRNIEAKLKHWQQQNLLGNRKNGNNQ